MADESSNYDVNIRTTAEGSGVTDTNAGLDSVDQKAAAINERQASLATQKETIAAKQLAALQAEALGETEVASQLQREVAMRRIALELQEQSAITEAEALAIAQARSVEEDKIYGKAGKFKLLQNFGLDANAAKTLAIAAFAGFQLQQYIEEAAKYYDDLRVTGEKEGAELEKQLETWKQMAASAKDFNDIAKLQESITQHATEQIEKLRTLPSEGTKGFFQNAADALVIFTNANLRAIGAQTQLKTSTDQAADALSAQIAVEERAGQVFATSAKKNADAIRAILALPYADGVRNAREEIKRLSDEQETLNRSDVKQEQSWQRKQAQINQLSAAIAQLAAEHELLAKKEELETQIALTGDPQKRAGLQKELQDLQLNVLIRQKIKQASDDAAAAGKGWTDAESKAIENEIKGPLEQKLKLLRELATINPTGGYQAQIDKMLNVKPASAQDSAKLFYEKVVNDAKSTAMEIQNAKANLELILQQELRDIAKTTPQEPTKGPAIDRLPKALGAYDNADAVAQSADEIGKSVAEGTGKIKASIDASVALIKPAFDPVAEAMNQIPDAVTQGAAQLVSTVGTLASAMRSELSKLDADLQRQIDAIWQQL